MAGARAFLSVAFATAGGLVPNEHLVSPIHREGSQVWFILLRPSFREGFFMRISSAIRAALVALVAFVGLSPTSYADSGTVTLTIYKGGWIIGASGGTGSLYFRGRYYPLSTGGLDYGLLFGGSKTVLHGRVSNIWRPSDVAGVYGAAGAGLAVGTGARAIVLTNQKGAVLELTGRQVGLLANLDLSGLAITLD
jgi:hypothetical protein